MSAEQYGITISPIGLSPAEAHLYVSQVKEHLRWIERTKMGKILLNSIRFYARPVEIRPYPGDVGACNATADMELETPSIGGIFNAVATAGQSLVKSVVSYSPQTWSEKSDCRQNFGDLGTLWDEVLFHELVHAFRFVSGKFKGIGSLDTSVSLHGGLRRYDDNEEFYAVMLQNIYVGDRTNKIKTGFVGSHGTLPLQKEYLKPWGFFSQSIQVFGLVDKFCQDHKGLSKRVANDLADSDFNPITEYYADRERARRVSQEALHKDIAMLVESMVWRLEDMRIIR